MSSWTGKGAATRIHSPGFDADFALLPEAMRERIEARLYEMGRRLAEFPHHRMKGSEDFRLRVGDYRIIYNFNSGQNVIHLFAVGNRREIYR